MGDTIANIEVIYWLLHDSKLTIAEISKGAGIPWTTVSDLKKGHSSVEKMGLSNAIKLTEYGKKVKNRGE